MEIPIRYEGLVIGKHGANLLKISEQTGAEVTREEGEVYISRRTK